jgi:putative hemolysin
MDSSPWPGPLALAANPHALAAFVRPLTGTDWGVLIALLIVLVIAGLASASETALTSLSHIKIRNLAQDGNPRAQLTQRLLREPNTFLSTILVVNNVAVIVASTLATILALTIFTSWGEIISTIVISLIVLIFCEISPKTAAVQNPERWALAVAPAVHVTTVVLKPVVLSLRYITTGLVRLFGGPPRVKGPFVTEEELRLLVDVGEEEGVLEEEEKEMIHNVFELGDTTAREVMVPRIDMVTIEADEPVEAALELIVQGGQSRIPVYSDSIDNIIGVLYAKDLLRVLASSHRPPSVRSLVRPAYFVPETKRLDDLLHELQQQRVHMAIVVDEYGGVAGLVTIEDVVEEIIGDIQDEYDREEVLYEKLSANEYIVDAKISLDDFNDLMDTNLASEDYGTLGGFVYTQLDKIPSVGDVVHFEDLTFTVLSTKGRRVTKVKVVRGAATEAEAPAPAASEPSGVAAAASGTAGDTRYDQPPEPERTTRALPAPDPSEAPPPRAPESAAPADRVGESSAAKPDPAHDDREGRAGDSGKTNVERPRDNGQGAARARRPHVGSGRNHHGRGSPLPRRR